MKTNLIKKYIAFFTGIIYLLSYFLQSFFFFDFNKVYAAENQLDYTNLVAVLVDNKIYDEISDEIERYAQDYIQWWDSDARYNSISNSKAIVLPIDVNALEATDIVKILENMYFDGVSGEPSKLVWTVLVGDIPLPVINQDGYIYPSIYPYVDFEEQKFIWNNNTDYFVYNNNPYWQAEIWHGIINFDETSEYTQYFEKLKTYSEEPSEFIGKNIWYDDLIANKQYFYKEALNSYINNFIFAEDIWYRRYTDLMVKLMQENHNDMIADLLSWFDGMEELQSTTNQMNTPTMSLERMIKEWYIKSYSNLIAGKQMDNIVKNVETANRWIEQYSGSDGESKARTALDTHYLKVEQKDETLLRMEWWYEPLITNFNQVLEDIVNEKIEEEKYWLNEVIPLTYLQYDWGKKINIVKPWKYKWVREKYEAFDNYFFWIKAKNIESIEQTSSYRGTFRNYDDIDNLTIEDIQESEYPSSDIDDQIDLNKKSIWWSYDIFATQVDANRWYNINNTIDELDIYNENKIAKREHWNTKCEKMFLWICWKKRQREPDESDDDFLCDLWDDNLSGCETQTEFAMRNRWGASPLNLSWMNERASWYNFQDAVFPIFDIAGSKKLSEAEIPANSFEGVGEYSRLIQKLFVPNESKYYTKNADRLDPDINGKWYNSSMWEDMKFTNWMPLWDLENPDWTYTNPKIASSVDYFDKYDSNQTTLEWDIIKITKKYDNDYGGRWEIFTYKTIDSRLQNNASTKTQINWSTFKAFQDDESPIKIFYEWMLDKIWRINDSVVAQIDSLQASTQSGIVDNLNTLSTEIQWIKTDVQWIINHDISSLSSLSSEEIQTLSDQREQSLTYQDYSNITWQVEVIQDQMINLDSFVENFSFDYFDDYIEQQFYNFQINKRDLILLDSWKTNILTGLMTTKNQFSSIWPYVDNAEDAYNTIPELGSTLNTQLLAKKWLINAALVNSSGLSLWCNSTYAELCNAIDVVRDNINNYRSEINENIDEISDFEFQDFDLNGWLLSLMPVQPFTAIQNKINNSNIIWEYYAISNKMNFISWSSNEELELSIPWMNMTTSDRPIDSPKYITFKGVGWDKVSFIYPNLYKSEVFSGDDNILKLKSPQEIEEAIKKYLIEKVKKYNNHLEQQATQKDDYYNSNPSAFDKLWVWDPLANPNEINNSIRPYNLLSDGYLIDELEAKINDNILFSGHMWWYEPIEFIAHMIYYQNIWWEQKEVWETIAEDIKNTRAAFDVNDRIKYIVDNYLITSNNKWNFITPWYRDDGYEVAFINSDGADYIGYKDEPSFVQRVRSAASNYSSETAPQIEQTQLEEELQNECNIPEDGWVLLFDLTEWDSPWLKSLRCWREKIREKPFEFEFDWSTSKWPILHFETDWTTEWTAWIVWVWNIDDLWDNMYGEVQSQYMNQLNLLDTNDENEEVLDNSNPGDYQKLEQIISYTKLEIDDQNINSDEASGKIKISAGVELWDVEFYIQNVWNSIFKLDDISNNITKWTTWYQTWTITFDPFQTKQIEFEITESAPNNIVGPVEWTNVLVFHMCLPWTQDINNCIKKTTRINVIPGELETIKLNTPGNKILEWSKLPIIVKWEDQFGNNVGNLLTERFEISVNTWSLSYQANKSNKITFSDFNKSEFILNADEWVKDGDQITISIDWINWSYGLGNNVIQVVKWYMDVKQNWVNIDNLSISLPNSNDYSYKDSFDITQSNLSTIPKIVLELNDINGETIDIENIVNIKTKNGLLKPGNIESRSITKSADNMTFEVIQNRFKQENNHMISGGQVTVYLMPNFDAGEDMIYISMPGIDEIQIPVNINPADASVIKMTSKKDSIATESSTKANLKITDVWGNIITNDTTIKFWSIWPVQISWFDTSSQVITIEWWELKFDINSKNKWWIGFVYAMIDWLSLDEQKPGNLDITVQERILPEEDLNVMYLNIFGSDWWNQWWYMSENNKYVENLISNSDRLLTTTTQLVSPQNIKKFTTIINPKLQILNIDELEVHLELDENILIDVWEAWIININTDDIKTQEVDVSQENQETVINNLVEDKYEDENAIIYVPESTDSIITSNELDDDIIYINWENVFDLNNMTSNWKLDIILSNEDILWYQIWELKFDEKLIGKMIFAINDQSSISLELNTKNPKYDYDKVWLNWSTNKKGIWFYEIDSSLPDDTMWYESIQDSIDPELSIWFRHDFKNITNFGAGESVWESTLPFSSEFLINIWDPLLKRVDKNKNAITYDQNDEENDTWFDKWLGEVIYSEPGKTIFKVKNIDFNNDWLEDIIVSFTDWTVKILKNYWGNAPFEKLGDLMILADGIKDIIIWDVDGNGYEDIIIWSKSDTLRVYKNNEWVFDVDGHPICINTNVKDGIVSQEPQNIWWVFQIFFEDMDQDGILDIVTNDKLGYIKIFYWWQNNPWDQDNYVSSDKYKCDENWYGKQSYGDNTNIVYRFGIRVNENIKVLDQSLVHWLWINPNEDINVDPENLWIDTSMFDEENFNEDNLDEILDNAMWFDANQWIEQYKNTERYKEWNFGKIPIYEDVWTWTEADILYTEIGCLTWEDPIKIYKQYEDLNGDVLENWDTVQISVILKANQDFVWTFIDSIKGPWEISLLENWMMEYFWFDTGSISEYEIENELEFHRDMVNSRYMMDNIIMSAWDELRFNYRVTYDEDVQTSKIEIKDIEWDNYHWFGTDDWETLDEYPEDEYPDIKVKPDWWCNKSMFILFNEDQNKDYSPEYVDLTELMINYSNGAQENLDNAMSSITNALLDWADSGNGWWNFSNIPWMDSVTESWDNLDIFNETFSIESLISNGWVDLSEIANAPMEIIDGLMWDVMEKVDSLMWDMCKWFDLSEYGVWWSENCGIPVPFNQAFLWPWNYHLFGCSDLPPLTNTIGKWLPTLTIPGNRPSPGWYIPAPWVFGLPFKWPTDGFLWVNWWTFDSQFRLYVVPTLTAEIWIAMCFGPYSAWKNIPDPASSIWWNCIVTAIPLPCKDAWSLWPNASNEIPEAYLDLEACVTQNVPCYVQNGESTSSLEMVSASSDSSNMTSAIPDGSFAGWFINIEKDPITTHGYKKPESWIEINGVKLKWWADSTNKILWSKSQWLIKSLSKNRMDKQINYILSNLTNFKVDVYWPDFWEVFGGMWNLWWILEEVKIKDCLEKWWGWDKINNECNISEKQKCENRGMERKIEGDSWICVKKSNPNQNEQALSGLDAWSQDNLISRWQVSNRSDAAFANPFEKMEAMFEEVPLINLRTENINVKVPMISSEDITAYISMSKNWIEKQQKILEERTSFFAAMIWICGWEKDINNFSDLKVAFDDLKKELKKQKENEIKGVENQIKEMEEDLENITDPEEKEILSEDIAEAKKKQNETKDEVKSIERKVDAIKDLSKNYDLINLWKYEIFEACEWDKFFIRIDHANNTNQILPNDIYLTYTPWDNQEIKMFTKWFDLIKNDSWRKTKISYQKNWETIKNGDVCFKSFVKAENNQCIDLFLWGKLDDMLDNFIDIQTNTNQLIWSVKQNIETLKLYKKFPLDLYERIHVWDRYLSEISSVVNNFLWALSLWMKTNATRYSQYVDSLILVMTTIQTYQAIIDLSVDWSQRCSSCTNDNYDQFACKLGLLCPDGMLPVLEIPPMKIPSIYIDLSNINMATDIKLPKFNFVPTSVPLPNLPNIPKPPSIDAWLDIEQSLSMWVDLVWQLTAKLDMFDSSLSLPSIPIIPSPPDLPEIPSFIPSVKMELPLLPPAPKIPKLPNEIKTSIKAAETIWQILCIVKGNIWLVWENSIKAKIEQITQRTYEVPYWDNLDQTLSEQNNQSSSKIPSRIKDTFGFLKSNEFEDVELKGFDIGVESHVNLQYNFEGFYSFLDQVVKEVNNFSSMPWDYMQEAIDSGNYYSKIAEQKMSACANNPISTACMWDGYTWDIKETNEKAQELKDKILEIKNIIEKWFEWVKEAIQLISQKETEKENLESKNETIEENMIKVEDEINSLNDDLEITTNENRRNTIISDIEAYKTTLSGYQKQLDENKIIIDELQIEIDQLYDKYWKTIESYEKYLDTYWELYSKYDAVKDQLSKRAKDALDKANETISSGDTLLDSWVDFVSNDVLQFDKIEEWNKKIQEEMDVFEQKQNFRREQRNYNLDNMYKDLDEISYIDYDSKSYEENLNKLKNGLKDIKNKTENKSFKKEIDEYIKLANLNNNIKPANDDLEKVKWEYSNIVNSIKNQNSKVLEEINTDYDNFLESVEANKVSLVWENDKKISISTKLFDIDQSSLDIIKSQENINKKYMDYHSDNIDWYLNAINNNKAEDLNMSQEVYNANKKYLWELKEKTKIAYNTIENKKLFAQNSSNSNSSNSTETSNNWGSFTDISSYIDWKVIKTPEWSIDLANDDYVTDFQWRTLMTDINNDWENDLIMRDNNNIYIKYRNNQNSYENTQYDDDYYMYEISSYKDLLANSEEWFVKIRDIYVKLGDQNREVKNFKYNGWDFDSIKLNWKNSLALWDNPKWYLVKMIHRVDLFNDKEIIVSNNNKEFFDKKYILVLPKWSNITGTKISLEEWTYRTENMLSWLIFDVIYYNENQENIDLTVQDIPRNWQYSEIYTLELYEDKLYYINNSSSNQIVAWPQILADTKWPVPIINLYRPSIESTIGTWEQFDAYVSTNYILQWNRKDNVWIKRMWIADIDGNNIKTIEDVNQKTWYIELNNLFFTWATSVNYYFGATDINDNSSVTQVNLNIKIPNIEIVDIKKYGNEIESIWSPATVTAEIDHDLDEWYVQFHRYRNDLWQIMTGTLWWLEIDKYDLEPYQTIITGGFYDFGDDIWLYLPNGELAVKINPNNGKIEIVDWYQNQVDINLDYSMKTPTVRITEVNWDLLFMINLPPKKVIEISTQDLEIKDLNKDIFWDFQWGKAIIDDDQVLIYVWPNGEIYTETEVYGDYSFDEENESVVYGFRKTQWWENLWTIELKIENMLEY